MPVPNFWPRVAVVLVVAAASVGTTAGAASATGTVVRVDGIYRVVSTDCYFAAGTCSARFDIEQKADVLSDGGDRYFHGHVRGNHIQIGETYPPGTSEDGWVAFGTTSNGGRTFAGVFDDGIGGTGTFKATFVAAG